MILEKLEGLQTQIDTLTKAILGNQVESELTVDEELDEVEAQGLDMVEYLKTRGKRK